MDQAANVDPTVGWDEDALTYFHEWMLSLEYRMFLATEEVSVSINIEVQSVHEDEEDVFDDEEWQDLIDLEARITRLEYLVTAYFGPF